MRIGGVCSNPGRECPFLSAQLPSLDPQPKCFSLISVTRAILNKPTGEALNITMDKDSSGNPPTSNPGSGNTLNNKDKDNPDGGSSDDDPSLSNKVNLDGSSANDNPGSRDFNTLHQLASSNTKASRFSLIISVTKAPLNEPTIEVMNTTMDTVSFGTLLMDDPGGFWPNGKGCAIYDYDYDVYRGG